jgi:hypothetical protein
MMPSIARAGCAARMAQVKVTSTSIPSSESGSHRQGSPHGPESGPRPQALSHGPEADALLDEVRDAVITLGKLLSHATELGEPVARAIRVAVDEVSAKLYRRELRVVVVGEERSGKSTFLDALLGERLLGLAKTPPNTVTTIRSSPELGYRAQLTDGFIDDFALRVPDQTAKLMTEIEGAEARLADAKRRSVAAAIEIAADADALERVEAAMADAFRAFEAAREDAERWSGKLDTVQQEWGRLCADATERANALPALFRRQPPWWALWMWVMRLVALLFYWPRWRRHRAVLKACGMAETEVDALRAESSRAAERCWQAEAKLGAANAPVEQARQALETSREIAHEAETACETLAREANEKRRQMQHEQSERKRRFVFDVRALSNMEDRGKDVLELEIDYPAWLLPDDIVLIEAPGVTSDDPGASERAWRAIRERADACILISELEHAVSGETQKFLSPLREAVSHAILVLTKMDETLSEAVRKGDGDPADQVEHARRIGTRRFAREMGRDAATVLSVTVAAEETLRGAPSSEPERLRFETDVAKLFTLLRYERALILGASSAGIVRRCIGGLAEAKARAASAHQDRITELEKQRIPNPDQFYAEQMKLVDGAIAETAKVVVTAAAAALREKADLVRVDCKAKIAACASKDELCALAPKLAEVMVKGMGAARDETNTYLEAEADRSAQDIEQKALQALRERYYILHQITRPPDLRVVVDTRLTGPNVSADLSPKLEESVRSFDRSRLGLGVGGAALGAGVGTLILPGIGSLAGALIGGLATFVKTLAALKLDFTDVSQQNIAGLERALAEQIAASEASVATAMRASLGKSLEQALARFAPFIDEPIEEERAAIASERGKLRDLEALHLRLQEHDARLASLMKTATDASVGLAG